MISTAPWSARAAFTIAHRPPSAGAGPPIRNSAGFRRCCCQRPLGLRPYEAAWMLLVMSLPLLKFGGGSDEILRDVHH